MRRKDFFKWSFGLRFLFVFLCTLMCVGNAWGKTISECDPAGISTIGTGENQKVYPEFDVWYYVYAKNHRDGNASQKTFWTLYAGTASTKFYSVYQTIVQTDDNIPATAMQVKFTKDANGHVDMWTMADGEERKIFFRCASTSAVMVQKTVNNNLETTQQQQYKDPCWTFGHRSEQVNDKTLHYFTLEGKKQVWSSGDNYGDPTDADIRAVYKKVNNEYNDFHSSSVALKTTSSTSGSTAAPYLTEWSFIKAPQKYNAAPTTGGDTGHEETVKVSTNGSTWVNSISEQEISAGDRIYFKAIAPTDDDYEFVGWYKAGTDDNTSGSNNLIEVNSEFNIPATAGTFNYVAVFRKKKTIYYSVTANVNNSSLGTAQVSLSPGNLDDAPNTIVGSFRSGFKEPTITFYIKTMPTDPAITIKNWSTTSFPLPLIQEVTFSTTNSQFDRDPETGIVEIPVTVHTPTKFNEAGKAMTIELTANYSPAVFYKGIAQKKGAWSSVDACIVKVGPSPSYNWNEATNEYFGFEGVEEETGGSRNKAIYFKAEVNDPDRYRAIGWYDGAKKLTNNADCDSILAVVSYDQEDPTTLTLQADFEESTPKYYHAEVEAVPNIGTVKVGFSSDLSEANASADVQEYNFNDSFTRTAYFSTEGADGYIFRCWSTTEDESGMIKGATNLTYSENLTVNSIDNENPSSIKRYAIYRAISDKQAQALGANENELYKGDLTTALAYSGVVKVKLLRPVELTNPLTQNNPVTLDLNGFNLTATDLTVNLEELEELQLINSDPYGFGKITLTTADKAIQLISGNLIINGADIYITGSGEDTYGISVSNGSKLIVKHGNVNVSASNNVYGLLLNGNAQLQGGTISARAFSSNAYAAYTNDGSSITVSGSAELVASAGTSPTAFAMKQIGGEVTILGGGFCGGEQDLTYADATKVTLQGGYFAHNTTELRNLLSDQYIIDDFVPSGTKFDPQVYHYSVLQRNSADIAKAVIVWKTGETTNRIGFSSLLTALDYANNHAEDNISRAILMRDDVTLEAGNYTIPVNATLVVPYSAEQQEARPSVRRVRTNDVPTEAYCTLTLKNGAHIEVLGAIEVGGLQTTGNIDAAGENGISRPGGTTYGLLDMKSGSSITLNNGARLYAWGFVVGEGTIDVRRGAIVREQFQINDWKGFIPTCNMAVGGSIDYVLYVLPVNQYFIQNVEVKTTYRPGSKLLGQVSALITDEVHEQNDIPIAFNDVGIVGVRYNDPHQEDDVAIFLMDNNDDSKDTWVCKYYDEETDQQVFDVNNSAYLGSLKMDIDVSEYGIKFGGFDVQDLNVDSREFVLPITNNFKIHLKSGRMEVTQNTSLLPGAVLEVDKKATVIITDSIWKMVNDKRTLVEEPQTLFVYDKAQWGTYVFKNKVSSTNNFGYATHIRGRHGDVPDDEVRDITSPAGLGNAQLKIHGTVEVRGYLKTTYGDISANNPSRVNKQSPVTFSTSNNPTPHYGGASITSSIEDAGTILFKRTAPAITSTDIHDYLWQVGAIESNTPVYVGDHVIPAWLANEDGSVYSEGDGYTETAGTAIKGQSFCFLDFDGNGKGEWVPFDVEDCFVKSGNSYYAKPQDYVELANGKTENPDHTYTSADGSKTLILVFEDCQWWEVKPVAGHPDLFKCEHPNNTTYYTYNEEDEVWVEKEFKVEWQNWDGSPVKYLPIGGNPGDSGDSINYYMLPYGSHPAWRSENPTREKSDYYTYDFIGWSPEITPSTIVTGDIVYTAQYKTIDRLYTITFEDAGHNAIANQYLKMGAIPTDPTGVDMTNKEWSPALGAVTGNTTYTLVTKNTAGPFDITFVNWNGAVLKKANGTDDAIYSIELTEPLTVPVYDGVEPSKPALADEAYDFIGWKTISGDTILVGDDLPGADANATYMAVFSKGTPKYTITWDNIDGNSGSTTSQVEYGQVPVYSGTPTKSGSTFVGWDPAIAAVTGAATYTAQFLENRTITNGQTIDAHTEVSTITIETSGALTINNKTLTAENLILKSTNSASGQIIPAGNKSKVSVTNAYYDLTLGSPEARHWNAFGVPWVVNLDVTPLVELNNAGEPVGTLVLGRDYDIVFYNGAKRAAQGAGYWCWEFVENHSHLLTPGQGYMIQFVREVKGVRFAKVSGTPVFYEGNVHLDENGSTSEYNVNNGWNAMSNPMPFHATMTNGPTVGYVHDGGEIGSDGYVEYDLADRKFLVGKTVYVQAGVGGDNVTPVYANGDVDPIVAAAPVRRIEATEKKYMSLRDYYQVAIASTTTEGGHIYVLPEEDKENKYVIGHDLAQFGMSTAIPQVWVNRYNTKLALNTTALFNETAEFPMGVYAPTAGEYTISLNAQPSDEYIVYLTRDGQAIWNLSDGAFTADLKAGIQSNYGLRLTVNKAPQVVTGIDEAVVDANGETRKVMINNQVYIIRGEQVYTIDGQLVK